LDSRLGRVQSSLNPPPACPIAEWKTNTLGNTKLEQFKKPPVPRLMPKNKPDNTRLMYLNIIQTEDIVE
jgi:hypothetical protein